MIDHSHSTAATNLVAIDVAKEWNVALVQEGSGRRRSSSSPSRADHDEFVAFLHSLDGSVQVGLEPTGDYHRNITHRLLPEGFQVVSISSLALARFRESRFGTWDKNDPKDAQVMLAMMAHGMVQVYWDSWFSGSHDWQESQYLLPDHAGTHPLASQSPAASLAVVLLRVHALLVLHAVGVIHSLPDSIPHTSFDSGARSRSHLRGSLGLGRAQSVEIGEAGRDLRAGK